MKRKKSFCLWTIANYNIKWQLNIFFSSFLLCYTSVATPTISASNGVTSYEISGTSVTLTCESTSDSTGSGTYVWELAGITLYVILSNSYF